MANYFTTMADGIVVGIKSPVNVNLTHMRVMFLLKKQ